MRTMSDPDLWSNGGWKGWIPIFLVMLMATALLIVYTNGPDTGNGDDGEELHGPPEETTTTTFMNFTVDNNTVTNKNASGQYRVYSIVPPKFSNKSANATLERYFGPKVNDTTLVFSNHNDEVFALVGNDHTYLLNSDGRIMYTRNTEPPGYPVDSIANDSTLNNITRSRALVESYINGTIGSEFSDFVFEKAKTSKSVRRQQESIFEYVFYYERMVDNISCFRNSGGQIVVTISPDGTINSFQYLKPEINGGGVSSICNLTKAMKDVDANFDVHSKNLLAGYDEYTLFYSESTYGVVDGGLKVGWQLYFYCDDDKSKVSSTFIA